MSALQRYRRWQQLASASQSRWRRCHDRDNIIVSPLRLPASPASASDAPAAPPTSRDSNSRRGISVAASNRAPPRRSRHHSSAPAHPSNLVLDWNRSGDRGGASARRLSSRASGGKLNEFGHDYTQIGGPVDETTCSISATEIHLLICTRVQCMHDRDFGRVDRLLEQLRRCGVVVSDSARTWRADGKNFFPRDPTSANATSDEVRIPRMSDCETMEEAIRAIHDNLESASHRDLAAFWTVVPQLLNNRGGKQQKLVPQLNSILDRTMNDLERARPRDLGQTAFAFAKIITAVEGNRKTSPPRGIYRDFLQDFMVDRKVALFQSIAEVSLPILSQFQPWFLCNLAYACAPLGEDAPKFDDGSTLFDRLGDASIPLLKKFKPQELSITLWSFERAGAAHPRLFKWAAEHIASSDNLDDYKPQRLSNILLAYSKAGVSHPALFERVADHVVGLDDLGSFRPVELSNTVWAMAKAGSPHADLFAKVADHVVSLDRVGKFSTRALSNLVWAYAKAGATHPSLFDAAADHVVSLDRVGKFAASALSNLLWAYAKAGAAHPGLFDAAADHVASLDHLNGFSYRSVCNLAWAFAREGTSRPPLFEKIADRVVSLDRPGSFESRNASDLAWAFASAGVPRADLFERVADHVVALESLDSYDGRDVGDLVWAFAKAGVAHAGLYDKVAEHVLALEDMESYDEECVRNIEWAFSKANVHNPLLREKLTDASSETHDERTSSGFLSNFLRWT